MTSGRFSDDAKTVARSNHISLIDGEMLLTLIERLPGGARQQLLAFATAGDYRTPTCPGCGATMRHVAGKGGRPDFWAALAILAASRYCGCGKSDGDSLSRP